MTAFQIVVWNHGIQVMNMVESNVTGKPLHDFWKFIIATAFHGSCSKVPVFTLCPVCVLKLMLHIEEPDSKVPATAIMVT